MEHVYDRDDGSYGTTEQNVFASPGSVIPGSASLTKFVRSLRFSEFHDGDISHGERRSPWLFDVQNREERFTNMQQQPQHTAGHVTNVIEGLTQRFAKHCQLTRKRR